MSFRRLESRQILKDSLDQTLVVASRLGLGPVTHHGQFHDVLPLGRVAVVPLKTFGSCERMCTNKKIFTAENSLDHHDSSSRRGSSSREEIAMTGMTEKTKKIWVLVLASTASCMVALDAMVVTTVLGAIRAGLGASLESLEWTVNAYNLNFAVLLLTGTSLGDRFGRRRLFCSGLGLFAVASVACASLADGLGWLDRRPCRSGRRARPRRCSLATAHLAAPCPSARGARPRPWYFQQHHRDRPHRRTGSSAELLRRAWLGSGSFGSTCRLPPLPSRWRPDASTRSFGASSVPDVPGIILATGSALGLAWGLVRGNSAGWNSLAAVAALGTGLVLAAGFVVCELRTGEPMMPIRFFRSGAFASGIASSFFFYASMYGVLFFLPQFLQATQGLCPFGAGVRLMPCGPPRCL